jgi:hypothetical protein
MRPGGLFVVDMLDNGAKARFHKKFADQQGGNGNEHAGVNTIIAYQGNQALEVQKGSD